MKLEDFKGRVSSFSKHLSQNEKSGNTAKKYTQAINNFVVYAEQTEECGEICKECIIKYKDHLKEKYKPKTVNLYIVGLNQFFKYIDQPNFCIKSLNIQSHHSLDNCITNEEYKKMLETSQRFKNRAIYLVIRTLACTGMRIKGLSYITVSVLKKGKFTVTNKGKTRSLIIPKKMCDELISYCDENGITESFVF